MATKRSSKKTPSKKISPEFCEVQISVLGFDEDGQWVALALEMDLRGYGKTFKKALEELEELIEIQLSFASFKNESDLIFHPAESTYWRLFEQVRQDKLRTLTSTVQDSRPEYQVGGLSLPSAHEIKNFGKNFALSGA